MSEQRSDVRPPPVQSRRLEIKRRHEKAVADELLHALGINGRFLRMGNDRGEPDVIHEVDGRTIGIEVATVYYEDSDARQEWTLAAGERELPVEGLEVRQGGILAGPDSLLNQRVQRELNDKAAKKYVGADEIWLVLRVHAPLATRDSMAECALLARTLLRALRHGFAAIYLQWQPSVEDGGDSRWEVLRLA